MNPKPAMWLVALAQTSLRTSIRIDSRRKFYAYPEKITVMLSEAICHSSFSTIITTTLTSYCFF